MRQCVVRLELRQKRMHRLLIVVEMCSAGLRTAEDAVAEDDPIAMTLVSDQDTAATPMERRASSGF
jgi:hypothetical protein